MAKQEQLTGALQAVVNLARCVVLKRTLAVADPNPALNFCEKIGGQV